MEEQTLVVEGGRKLEGEIALQGAKNSVLPILCAATLVNGAGETLVHNCPVISDVYITCRISACLGCECRLNGNTMSVRAGNEPNLPDIPDDMMCKMRASITFLGAALGRYGECFLSQPGGCDLGLRPIDMHLAAFRKMGVCISEKDGELRCRAEKGVKGAKITLHFPSVGATENIMLAAALADGETVIRNAAREPEIVDLAGFINACGGKVRGAGTSTVVIEGVEKLHPAEYTVMTDRIVAATYMAAAAATRGELRILGAKYSDMETVAALFEGAGCRIYAYSDNIYINAAGGLNGTGLRTIQTMTYPGFPTDAQAVTMAALATARGVSIFEENIFENRYRHVEELLRMGANIKIVGKAAFIDGVSTLRGAKVRATDLRGGAALVVAALGAQGKTEIRDIQYIDRGYECIENSFSEIGGRIIRK